MRFLLSTAVILAAATGVAVSAHGRHGAPREGQLELIASVRHLTIRGVSVEGLYPGAVKSLKVTVTNGEKFTIKVKPLKVSVAANTGRNGCTGKAVNLIVTAPRATVKLARSKKHTDVLRVRMPNTVANACQGVSFKITVKARATR
jgi:pyrroline-5-carboxylate reductase